MFSAGITMARSKVIRQFAQRALWIYIAEAAVVLAVVMIAHAYS
jgi:hypothetical protein